MHHPSRLAAVLGLVLSVSSLAAPLRSFGQDPAPYPPSAAMEGSAAPSGGLPGDTANPQVGVDTAGHADAVGTRNGRTTRRRAPVAPANPLVLLDPNRPPGTSGEYPNAPGEYPSAGPEPAYPADPSQNGAVFSPSNGQPGSAPYGPADTFQNGGRGSSAPYSLDRAPFGVPYGVTPPATGNRLIPPVVTREPGDYTVQTDPSAPTSRRAAKPLPLFGYDFFQPARQIIIARRRALLPAPRPVRYPVRSNGNRSNGRPGQPVGPSGNGYNPNTYNPNSYNPNAYNPNPYNSNGYNTAPGGYGAGDNTGFNGDPALGYGAAALSGGPSNGAYQNGSYPNSTDPNGAYQNGAYQNGSAQNDPYAGGGQPGDYTGDGTYPGGPNGGDIGARRSADPYSANDPNAPGGAYGADPYGGGTFGSGGMGGDTLPGDVTSGPARRRSPNASGYDSQYNSQYNSQDPNAPYSGAAYPGGPYSSPSGFPGDASSTLGGDIQFPGDNALVQNGGANAVTGQIADPVSTLYKNVLASLPPNYQLQPGDSLTIRVNALTLAPREYTTTVDLQGGVNVEGVGRISVAGRTASQAEDALRARLSRLYRNVDVSISLRQLRTIQVTVSGAAFAPGTYTVPATATAFNLLNAAGGPTADGSLRDIRVLRGGRLVGSLDIYPLLGATGSGPFARAGDIALQPGDNIYIPGRLSRISVRGEVRQAAIYELTGRETLRDALRYAGGVKPSGVDQNVHIDTINSGTDRVIRDVNLRDKTKVASVPVFDGDTIDVASIRSIITNRVSIQGAVTQPGDFALTPGLTVSELIAKARGPLYNAYLDRADLLRLNADNTTTRVSVSIAKALDGDPTQNIPLKRFDQLRLYTLQDVSYLGRRLVTVRGAVQRPGLYTQSDNMKVSDLLLDSGGPLPDAYLNRAVLLHQRGDGTYAYAYVSLRDIDSGVASADLPVSDNDVLAVYKIGEAHFTPDHTVKVLGNVVAPGLYARGTEMRLSDLLKLAGAFKPGGGTRVSVAHARRPVSDKAVQVASAAIPAQNVSYAADQTVSSGTDLVLQDGDVVAVQGDGTLRDHPAVVTVTGMVLRPGPIFVQQGMHLSDAIKQAGGLRPEAFPEGAEFTRTSEALATTGQLNLAGVISRMSDMLNLSQAQRERAKANLELIQAAGSAASGTSSPSLIPGLGGAAASAPSNPNLAPLTATLAQNNLVTPGRLLTPSQLQPNGSVAVQLASALKRPGSIEDVLLKDGDTLVVPETPTTVQVVGAVFNARGVLYRPGQSIDYYIQRSGDFTPDAARDRIEVIHAGGGLIPASKAGALQPGDLILVPTKVLAEKIGKSGNGFSDFFQGLVGSAITLKVLSSVFGL